VALPSVGPGDAVAAASLAALEGEIETMRRLEHRHIVRVAPELRLIYT
jgi:hypothetical protein